MHMPMGDVIAVGSGSSAPLSRGQLRRSMHAFWAPSPARDSDLVLWAGCGMPSRDSVLFARNLFLPEDLGGNRYPYEVIRRLGARGHDVTVATPRLGRNFPPLPNVRYHLYAITRPHPAVS